jgi:hypothetical protein
VKKLAGHRDPIQVVTALARRLVIDALDRGWAGPPFDPIALATDFLKLSVSATDGVLEARTVPTGASARIEYNPNRPRERRRYSVAHEIAHTLFPDYGDRIRHRGLHGEARGSDDWQLEMLCNIAAAEFLMPIGSLPVMDRQSLAIDALLKIRPRFDVSMEAVLIRAVRMSATACAVFTASRIEKGAGEGAYRLDYVIPSRDWSPSLRSGALLPAQSCIRECTAIGFTAKGVERWRHDRLNIECVGVPPYPGSSYPRVAGVALPIATAADESPGITFLVGDALRPRGEGRKIVAHVVNDATPNWGGHGFATALRKARPEAQKDFQLWGSSRGALKLGNVRIFAIEPQLSIASLVAQRGYGSASGVRRLRYAALEQSLDQVATYALSQGASVHMPRLGSGQGGAAWPIVQEIVSKTLSSKGVAVYVYDLPYAAPPPQSALSFEP